MPTKPLQPQDAKSIFEQFKEAVAEIAAVPKRKLLGPEIQAKKRRKKFR